MNDPLTPWGRPGPTGGAGDGSVPQAGWTRDTPPQPHPAPPVHHPWAPARPGPGEPFDGAWDPRDLSRPLYGATPVQAVTRFFRSYARFSGRASRSEYWWAFLAYALTTTLSWMLLIGSLIAQNALTFPPRAASESFDETAAAMGIVVLFAFVFALLVSAGFLVPMLSVAWRRFQDAGYPGPLALISLSGIVPYIGWVGQVVVLAFMATPSQVTGRRFDRAR